LLIVGKFSFNYYRIVLPHELDGLSKEEIYKNDEEVAKILFE
jgi:hypothetical protein